MINQDQKLFLDDTETAHKINNTDIYVHLRAVAESGSDFSCWWMKDDRNTLQIFFQSI